MLVPLLIFASVGCLGLLAALRPEVYVRYFLAEFQRRALSGNLKAVSFVGWVIFCGCMAVVIALPFQSKWSLLAPVFSPLFFLVCAVAYIWWSRTPAQPRIIPQANNGAMEPPTNVGCQMVRVTVAAWCGGLLIWLRGKNQSCVAVTVDKSP